MSVINSSFLYLTQKLYFLVNIKTCFLVKFSLFNRKLPRIERQKIENFLLSCKYFNALIEMLIEIVYNNYMGHRNKNVFVLRSKGMKMRTLIYNEENLKDNEISGTVVRVKVFLINSDDEILIANANGGCQLPGGHLEKGEKEYDAVKREILEETGILLDNKELTPSFFEIKHYSKNYYGTGKNVISKIMYYSIHTDKKVDKEKLNLTDREKKNKFDVHFIKFDDFEDYVHDCVNETSIEINKVIAKEMLYAYKEMKKIMKKKEKNTRK